MLVADGHANVVDQDLDEIKTIVTDVLTPHENTVQEKASPLALFTPRSCIISARSRWVTPYLQYQRTRTKMISTGKRQRENGHRLTPQVDVYSRQIK
jgi:hypothetical protein